MPFRTKPLGSWPAWSELGSLSTGTPTETPVQPRQARVRPNSSTFSDATSTTPGSRRAAAHAGALSHDVIHGLDVTEALGLPASPPDRIALALASAGPRQLKFFGVGLKDDG